MYTKPTTEGPLLALGVGISVEHTAFSCLVPLSLNTSLYPRFFFLIIGCVHASLYNDPVIVL